MRGSCKVLGTPHRQQTWGPLCLQPCRTITEAHAALSITCNQALWKCSCTLPIPCHWHSFSWHQCLIMTHCSCHKTINTWYKHEAFFPMWHSPIWNHSPSSPSPLTQLHDSRSTVLFNELGKQISVMVKMLINRMMKTKANELRDYYVL